MIEIYEDHNGYAKIYSNNNNSYIYEIAEFAVITKNTKKLGNHNTVKANLNALIEAVATMDNILYDLPSDDITALRAFCHAKYDAKQIELVMDLKRNNNKNKIRV